MDAADLRAFDELASETGRGLFPVSLKIAGVDVEGSGSEPRVEGGLEEGSEPVTGEAMIWIHKSLLAAKPVVDSPVVAWGRNWTVREVGGDSSTEAEWWVRCDPKN